ncbi:MAG: hypothetical protein ACO1OQ_05830 [Rufibacter sp.]
MHTFRNPLLLLLFGLCLLSCDDNEDPQPDSNSPYGNYIKVSNAYYELTGARAVYDESQPDLFQLWLFQEEDQQRVAFDFLRTSTPKDLPTATYRFQQPTSGNTTYEAGKFYFAYTKYPLPTGTVELNSVENTVEAGEAKIKKLGNGIFEITYKLKFNSQLVEGYYKGEVEFFPSW